MMMLMMMIISMSMIFLSLNHPLSMGMILLCQTLLISLITGISSLNFWYSYILFLIMVGGMLVLFIYMTSIASNEKFTFSNLIFMMMFMMLMIMLIMYMNIDMYQYYSMNMYNKLNYTFSLNKFLNYPSNILLFMMIIYLFITLIAVVKITNIKIGPLRQK
uniref:NADH-ubiquinone oxidoreductase chain 6 n=1 Tax=Eusphalerum torquatum TaxID=878013 RepID=A0A0S2M794_9COLE|nr:NADH deshydrogenase subunit 6 [Eusphalerum torquatum]